MATLISTADGNFTSSSTWSVVDSTSFVDSVAATVNISSSAQFSASFTPGAITVAGIALQVRSRESVSPSGTYTVRLRNITAGTDVTGTTVTINISDLPNTNNVISTRGIGWIYCEFAAPVTLLAATNYAVAFLASAGAQMSLWTSSGAGGVSRALVTTTAGTPAATDVLIISGKYTGVGASTTCSVTMDSTANTSYGQIYVSPLGTLAYGTSASTNYYLRLAGNLIIGQSGTFNIGTSGTPIPATSTAVLEFVLTSSAQYGMIVGGGTVNMRGQPKTNHVRLNADAAVGASTITLSAIPTSWDSGDIIGITSTTTTTTAAEIRTLSANVTTTSASFTPALSFAHGGNSTTLIRAHVVNLSRNISVRGTNATFAAYARYNGAFTTVDIQNVQFQHWGSGGGSLLGAATLAGSIHDLNFVLSGCAFYHFSTAGFGFTVDPNGWSGTNNYTFSNNSMWNMSTPAIIYGRATNMGTKDFSNNVCVRSGAILQYIDPTVVATNLVIANGAGFGFYFFQLSPTYTVPSNTTLANLDGLECYGSATNVSFLTNQLTSWVGTTATGPLTINCNNWTIWRASGTNIDFGIESPHPYTIININNARIFGATSQNVRTVTAFATGGLASMIVAFNTCRFWANTGGAATAYCIIGGSLVPSTGPLHFVDCTFGRDHNGNTSNFGTAVISIGTLLKMQILNLYNPTISGTILGGRRTVFQNSSGYSPGITVQNLNGVTGSNFIYYNTHTVSRDTTIFKTASPSTRVENFSVAYSPTVRIPIKSGQTCTVRVWVRKPLLADGGAYTGAQPYMVWRYNMAANNLDNTTVATMTVGNGVWEQLSYTTPTITQDTVLEFMLVFTGTPFINIDEWTVAARIDTRDDFIEGNFVGQYIEPDYTPSIGGNGGSFTFIS